MPNCKKVVLSKLQSLKNCKFNAFQSKKYVIEVNVTNFVRTPGNQLYIQESISCDKTGAHVGQNGVIYSQTNYVTLKYVTDSWGTDENGFKMIITAFRDASYGCHNGFQCSTDTCIDNDLVCDNIHHCVDGADERHSEFCACKSSQILNNNSALTGTYLS